MGFLDLFRQPRSNVAIRDDLIWMTKEAKHAGIAATVTETLEAGDAPTVILLVAHFEDCLTAIRGLLDTGVIDDPRAFCLLATELTTLTNTLMGLDESACIDLVVAERHPLGEMDAAVLRFAEGLPCRCRLVHHASLEDALLRQFAGEWVQSILEELGMKHDEAIESRMVSRRIAQAQKKNVPSATVVDQTFASAEAWYEANGE